MTKNKKTFYITTPIYYPSGNLHIGHVYTTTLAWTLANFKKLAGYDVKFLTGADEHGQKIELKAFEEKIKPQKYVDKMSLKFKELWKMMDIEYDYFSRTTNPIHKKVVQDIFSKLLKEKIIYKDYYKGLYSIPDEEFFTKVQALKKDDKYFHPLSGHELKDIEEETYFFKMSKFANWLSKYYLNNPNFIIPNKIEKELTNNFLKKGLEELSITRSTFKWGISVKEDKKHIIYVWLDALNNYITALGYGTKNNQDFIKYWQQGDEIIHIVGKEITRFHCIYWPIILKSLNIKLPTSILSHGWIITPEGKMSKSKGNVVDPIKLINKYGAEVIKYFFVSQINMGEDGIFDETLLKNIYNTNLANNFGNLISRTIAMVEQNFDYPIKFKETNLQCDKELIQTIKSCTKKYIELFNNYQVNKSLQIATKLSKKLNNYIDVTTPWKLKDEKDRLEIVLNNLLNGIYAVWTMLSVVIPKKANEVLQQLNIDEFNLELINNFNKFDNIVVQKGNVIFKRIS